MNFEELNDDEWMLVSSLVSDDPPIRLNRRGRPRAEPRIVANAVLWILTTGESWSRLPARYPSGPTCRRRFDDWHVSGTLIEIVKRLTQVGRSFVYVPEPVDPASVTSSASSVKQAAVVEESADDDGQPAVYWKSPETWQVSASAGDAPIAADAIESMTRQLASPSVPAVTRKAVSALPARAITSTAVPVPAGSQMPRDESPSAARSTLWTSDGMQSVQIAEWRGYAINLTVQPVRNRMYRASVEILKDGQRVERSGLIGPRFQDRDSAKQFAYDWARKWIEHECRGVSATPLTQGSQRPAGTTVTRAPNAVIARPALANATSVATSAPGNVRLAPLQRYTAASSLRPGNDSDTVSSPAEPQYRPHSRTHAG
ncbi:transposase [Paraburkholderia dinghuensis]|uniref:transposase n=1 Tax=Paraburkholderia dinghuensis TaxID=2305225 RepID=UPI001FE2CAC2|nr:transposase [Paraburkholderia dinghuensis]